MLEKLDTYFPRILMRFNLFSERGKSIPADYGGESINGP